MKVRTQELNQKYITLYAKWFRLTAIVWQESDETKVPWLVGHVIRHMTAPYLVRPFPHKHL